MCYVRSGKLRRRSNIHLLYMHAAIWNNRSPFIAMFVWQSVLLLFGDKFTLLHSICFCLWQVEYDLFIKTPFQQVEAFSSLVCFDQAVISPKILSGWLSNNPMGLDITWTVGESQLLHSRGFSLPSPLVKKRQVGDLPSTSRFAIGRKSTWNFCPRKEITDI